MTVDRMRWMEWNGDEGGDDEDEVQSNSCKRTYIRTSEQQHHTADENVFWNHGSTV